jgi:hypothetical protein
MGCSASPRRIALRTLFDEANGPAPTLDVDPSSNKIVVRGTPEQVAAVKDALKKLGEDQRPDGANPQRLKQLEDQLDKLHLEVEALRRQLLTDPQRDRRPR